MSEPNDDGSVHVPIKSRVVGRFVDSKKLDAAIAEQDELKTRIARLEEERDHARRHLKAASHLHDAADKATDVWMARAYKAEAERDELQAQLAALREKKP